MTGATLPLQLRLRAARTDELEAVHALLTAARLGTADVDRVDGRFIVAQADGDRIVGCVALEGRGPELLLRSLAVDDGHRGAGLGGLLVEAALLDAWGRRAKRVVLVTDTAERFFARVGFRRVEREAVGEDLRSHPQFTGACPASAAVMMMELTG